MAFFLIDNATIVYHVGLFEDISRDAAKKRLLQRITLDIGNSLIFSACGTLCCRMAQEHGSHCFAKIYAA